MSATTAVKSFASYRAVEHTPASATGQRALFHSTRGDHAYRFMTSGAETHYDAELGVWVFGEIRWEPATRSMIITEYQHATSDELRSGSQTANLWTMPDRLGRIPGEWYQLPDGSFSVLLVRDVICPLPEGMIRRDGIENMGDCFQGEPVFIDEVEPDVGWSEQSYYVFPTWSPAGGLRIDMCENVIDSDNGFTLDAMEAFHAALGRTLEQCRGLRTPGA